MSAIIGLRTFATKPEFIWIKCTGFSYFRWKWCVYLVLIENKEEIILWCDKNINKFLAECVDRKWISIQCVLDDTFYYGDRIYDKLPQRIRIWFKKEEDATAFKLRWQ